MLLYEMRKAVQQVGNWGTGRHRREQQAFSMTYIDSVFHFVSFFFEASFPHTNVHIS